MCTSCLSTLRCLSKTPINLVILLMAAFVKATIKDVPKTNQVADTLACNKSPTQQASVNRQRQHAKTKNANTMGFAGK